MSFTTTVFPIIAALFAPEGKFLPKNVHWNAINPQQVYFLKNIYTDEAKKQLALFTEKELRYFSSNDYEVLNKFARDNGFEIQLDPFPCSSFGSVAILDVILKWKEKGKKTELKIKSGPCGCLEAKYKAAELKNNFEVIQTKYINPIIKISTQAEDTVYLTIADNPIDKLDNLLDKINLLKTFLKHNETENLSYDNLIFPCVDLNQQVDINWLRSMYEDSGWFVDQALQQTKFKMNEEGAHVESCVLLGFKEMGMLREINNYYIDKPFYIWIERKNVKLPIFAGYITQKDWIKA